MKFLVILDLEINNAGVVKYSYPEWFTDEMKQKVIIVSELTPADSFSDVVIETDNENEIDILNKNNAKQLTDDEYKKWYDVKKTILELRQVGNIEENKDNS